MDLVIQKATELGADAIIPVISGRTVVKVGDAQTQKRERWKRLAIEASKQCGRSAVPDIMIPSSLRTFIPKNRGAKKIFLSEHGGVSLKEMLMSPLEKKTGLAKSVILLVGPEGGWTEIEEQDMMDSCYEAVSLGSHTLRSETAAIVSLALITHFWKNEDVS
jgi:16S rRNA (uracil1498-N3)-methyltransferase